ncbi:MAG TPA: hypothetical protein VH062_28570 [Polyangiaceae bacterium]|jgi:hypothetical protein|nr:hypothetical protein [Polyangiaceae bacterium]
MARRRKAVIAVLAVMVAGIALFALLHRPYPSDRTPEGAYARIARAVNLGRPKEFFAYLETPAQHAAFTIHDYRKKARDRVLAAYPEPEKTRLATEYAPEAEVADGPELFALYAEKRGYMARLRRDLSGIASVETNGERAVVVTARGTRYAFRRRPENGIWGLTLFTASLVADAEKAARDLDIVEKAAADYARAAP